MGRSCELTTQRVGREGLGSEGVGDCQLGSCALSIRQFVEGPDCLGLAETAAPFADFGL